MTLARSALLYKGDRRAALWYAPKQGIIPLGLQLSAITAQLGAEERRKGFRSGTFVPPCGFKWVRKATRTRLFRGESRLLEANPGENA